MASRAALVACALVGAAGMFADQAGVHDRVRTHIGPPVHAFGGGRSAVVATSAGAIASLALATGNVTWRVVAEEGTTIRAVTASKSLVAAVLATPSRCLVRAWAPSDGSLLWEAAAQATACDAAAVVVCGGAVVVTAAGSVTELDAATGAARPGGGDGAAAACTGGSVAVASVRSDGYLVVRGAVTGTSAAPVLAAAGVVLVPHGGAAATAVGVSAASDGLEVVCAGGAGGSATLAFTHLFPDASVGAGSGAAVAIAVAAVADTALATPADGAAFVVVALADGRHAVVGVAPPADGAAADVDAAGNAAVSAAAGATAFCGDRVSVVLPPAADPAALVAAVAHLAGRAVLFHATTGGGADAAPTVRARGVRGDDVGAPWALGAVGTARAHGPLVRVLPLPPSAATVPAAARLLAVWADGHTELLRGAAPAAAAAEPAGASSPVWTGDEGGACVVQAITLDLPATRTAAGAVSGAADTGDNDDDDPSLGLAARLAAQAAAALAFVPSRVSAVWDTAASLAADPAGAVAALVLPRRPAPVAGRMAAGVASEFAKLLVTRSRTDGAGGGCGAALGAPPGSGSLAAEDFESGDVLWRLATPVAPGVAAGAPSAVVSLLVLSRPRPLASHGAELMLVEAAEGGPAGGAAVFVTWIDAATGRVTGATAYAAPAPLLRVARTPVVHAPSHREVFALLHADGAAVVLPGGGDVRRALSRVGADAVVADVLGGAATGSFIDVSGAAPAEVPVVAGAAAVAAGSAAVPLLAARSRVLWRAALTSGDAAATGERVLAVLVGGVGVAGTAPLLSSDYTAAAAAAGAHHLVGAAALAAAAGGEAASDGTTSGGQLPGSPAQILGDDSLLLKYTSPHVVVVVTGLAGPTPSAYEVSAAGTAAGATGVLTPASGTAAAPAASVPLTLTLLDSVTGRVLGVQRFRGAVGPVALARHEHWVVATFWSARARRPEVATVAMYEGALDTCVA